MNLDGNARRKAIVAFLAEHSAPVSGTELAKHFNVSRQIIVQDVALLRAENRDILSTNKGYALFMPKPACANTGFSLAAPNGSSTESSSTNCCVT